ncbi:MAG: hypothetical protein ABIG20_00225 [archaeon]
MKKLVFLALILLAVSAANAERIFDPQSILDVSVSLDEPIVAKSSELSLTTELENLQEDPLRVYMTYIVTGETGSEFLNDKSSVTLYTTNTVVKSFNELNVGDGKYQLTFKISYLNYTGDFKYDFEVDANFEAGNTSFFSRLNLGQRVVLIALAILLGLLLGAILHTLTLFPKMRKKRERIERLNKILNNLKKRRITQDVFKAEHAIVAEEKAIKQGVQGIFHGKSVQGNNQSGAQQRPQPRGTSQAQGQSQPQASPRKNSKQR